jgi:hypothetical protein
MKTVSSLQEKYNEKDIFLINFKEILEKEGFSIRVVE